MGCSLAYARHEGSESKIVRVMVGRLTYCRGSVRTGTAAEVTLRYGRKVTGTNAVGDSGQRATA